MRHVKVIHRGSFARLDSDLLVSRWKKAHLFHEF
jgi:hypothetical protein